MLFLKIFDQCEDGWQDDAETQGRAYRSAIPEDCRWRNWAAYKNDKPQTPADEIIGHVNNTVFPGLKELPLNGNPAARVVREVFVDANNYMKSGTLMLGVIEKLEEAIDFHDLKARGQLGDIYEQVLNDLRSAGNAGEFYTPRAVTEFMVDRVNPRLGSREAGRETVLDPACGTGGFFAATIAQFNRQITDRFDPDVRRAIDAFDAQQYFDRGGAQDPSDQPVAKSGTSAAALAISAKASSPRSPRSRAREASKRSRIQRTAGRNDLASSPSRRSRRRAATSVFSSAPESSWSRAVSETVSGNCASSSAQASSAAWDCQRRQARQAQAWGGGSADQVGSSHWR